MRPRLVTKIIGGAALIIVIILLSHVPFGYYVQPCRLSNAELADMERVVINFDRAIRANATVHESFVWFADTGFLLGVVREGSIIDHDKDMDIGWFESLDKPTRNQQEKNYRDAVAPYGLTYYGGTLTLAKPPSYLLRLSNSDTERHFVPKLELNGYNTLNDSASANRAVLRRSDVVDMELSNSITGRTQARIYRTTVKEYAVADILPIRYLPMYHRADGKNHEKILDVPVPRNAEKILEEVYGSSWRTPVPWKVRCYLGV